MCDHQWVQVNEQFLLGDYFPVGYECELCGKWVEQGSLTPSGLGGTMTTKHKLVGAHGGYISTASGKPCRQQIYDSASGKVEYVESGIRDEIKCDEPFSKHRVKRGVLD